MKSSIKEKLSRITDIWNEFILEYKFCNNKVQFSKDVQSNYFGDIITYFKDTLDVVFDEKKTELYPDTFAYHISLLQSIYVQQDFISELLWIFKCRTNTGVLKKDDDYSINRNIRNELVGHPIRKTIETPVEQVNPSICDKCERPIKPEGKEVLLSSTIFSNGSDCKTIKYLLYHKVNDYTFEVKTFSICDILKRHQDFLNRYLDEILVKLKEILDDYKSSLETLNTLIDNQNFKTVIDFVNKAFESILNAQQYLYDKESLIAIFDRRAEHERYQNFIDIFLSDLKKQVVEKIKQTIDIFEPKQYENNIETVPFDISFSDNVVPVSGFASSNKVSYNYELGKLADHNKRDDFDKFSKYLAEKCSSNNHVISELKHMKSNLSNDIEYYTSFRLIRKVLKQ